MKWLGIDDSTPTNDTPGAMTTVENARMKVEGEMRRRRGTARTSLAKASGAITAIADFALSPSNPYALTYINGTINGDQGITSQWSDAALSPVSGSSYPVTGSAFTITLARGLSQYATSIIVFAQSGTYPTDQAQGIYVSETAISPWSTTATASFTAPASGTWYFRAYPVRDGVVGPGANLTPTAVIATATVQMFMTHFGSQTGTLDLCSAPAAYFTPGVGLSTFAYGQAVAAGAITLPYSFTIGNSIVATVELLFAFSNLYASSGYPKAYAGGPSPTAGTITISASGTTVLA